MKTKMTLLGIVIATLGCTVALAAAPGDAASEAVTFSAAAGWSAAPSASPEDLVGALTKAVRVLSVLPVGG